MQLHPIKSTLKSPGTERLKLEYDDVLSILAFTINLRHYDTYDDNIMYGEGLTPRARELFIGVNGYFPQVMPSDSGSGHRPTHHRPSFLDSHDIL